MRDQPQVRARERTDQQSAQNITSPEHDRNTKPTQTPQTNLQTDCFQIGGLSRGSIEVFTG